MSEANSGLRFEQQEQAFCDSCDSVIAGNQISARVIKNAAWEPTLQKVMAYCPHCKRVYSVVRRLIGGTWQVESGPTVITAAGERSEFLRQLHRKNGGARIDEAVAS